MTEITFEAGSSGSQEVQLAPGYYDVTASAQGYYSQSVVAHVVEGSTTNVSFSLREQQASNPKYTLRGSVAPLNVHRTVTITKVGE